MAASVGGAAQLKLGVDGGGFWRSSGYTERTSVGGGLR
jgi:hypothetical protein